MASVEGKNIKRKQIESRSSEVESRNYRVSQARRIPKIKLRSPVKSRHSHRNTPAYYSKCIQTTLNAYLNQSNRSVNQSRSASQSSSSKRVSS